MRDTHMYLDMCIKTQQHNSVFKYFQVYAFSRKKIDRNR